MELSTVAWEEARRAVGTETDESHLLARCQAGDRAAQEDLVRRCQQQVYRLARHLLGNQDDALDATQEALVAMLRSLPGFQRRSRFDTWLYRLTTNVCLQYRRRLLSRTRLVTSTEEEDLPAATTPSPETLVLDREQQAAVWRELARLPMQFRVVVVLRELEGLAYEEIAESLGVPLGTVQSRLNRGRRLLREALLANGVSPASSGGRR